MLKAYRLFTGADGNSHVERGTVETDQLVDAVSVSFKETPAHSSLDWHNDPVPQYVITLSGVLEFTTVGGECLGSVRATSCSPRITPAAGTSGASLMISRGGERTSFSSPAPTPISSLTRRKHTPPLWPPNHWNNVRNSKIRRKTPTPP
jgi:hypothetical protein